MHRIVAYAHNGVQRFAIDRSEMVIGSGEHCDIRLPYSGVAQQHARLIVEGERLDIHDLGTRKGVVVNGRRIREARLQVLDEIRLGSIALLIEDVEPRQVEETPWVEEPVREAVMTAERMHEHLAGISSWVLADSASTITLESLVIELLNDFGGGVLFLFQGEGDKQGIKFVVATEARWLSQGEELLHQAEAESESSAAGTATAFTGRFDQAEAWIAQRAFFAVDRPYLLVLAVPRFHPSEWSPLAALRTLGDQLILGLVHHVGRYEPILFGRQEEVELTLAPGLIAGESKAMKRVLKELRSAVDPPINVLLRGEPGVSKEHLARSLHLSSSRRDLPFIIASCRGAKPNQIEADLFGAEIPGKTEPVVREGKLLQADGGTLYLDDVEELPLDLQDRLVRFIRSGEIEPAGSSGVRRVDVRLIAASLGPLEPHVARDLFRLDLAYRLSQYAIDVPALRDRREDLPLLIQAAVNRCCHRTGKRIQGITVKALEALAVYDYPGNLLELDNIVRRLVYLCPSGRPIDESMLPNEVRRAKIPTPRFDSGSDLDLEQLVSDCERAAIREALSRNTGNKSAAARQLGLSRNGLAMKMRRLGFDS